jgi:hemoglobin
MAKWCGSIVFVGLWALAGCQHSPPPSLYDRLGGDPKISQIASDLVDTTLADPKVNFTRKGTEQQWQATPDNVDKLKSHLTEYLEAVAGGRELYEGRDMKSVHAGMGINNHEFDAFVADLNKTLASNKVPPAETSELLSAIEKTRGQIVEVK